MKNWFPHTTQVFQITNIGNDNHLEIITTSTAYELIQILFPVRRNSAYVLTFKYRTSTGYAIATEWEQIGITGEKISIYGGNYISEWERPQDKTALARSNILIKEASSAYTDYSIEFNSGNNSMVAFAIDSFYLDDDKLWEFDINALALSGNSVSRILSIRYIKLEIYKNRGNVPVTQLSLIKIMNEKRQYLDISGSTVTSNKSGASQSEECGNVVDGSVDTKFCVNSFTPSQESPLIINIALASTIDGTNYCLWEYYTANDYDVRDPVTFNLYVSEDGTNYILADSVENTSPTSNRKSLGYTGCIANLS